MHRSKSLVLVIAGILAACGAGSGIGGVSGGGGGVSTSLKKEIGAAAAEELNFAVSGLTLTQLGAPFGFTLPAGCPVASNNVDLDADNILDGATYTHTDPPCNGAFPGGGTVGITGDLQVQDQDQNDNTSFSTTASLLAWEFLDATLVTTETATRIGTRFRIGTPDTASLAFDMVTNRLKPPVTAAARIHTVGILNYTANVPGALDANSALPSGSATLTGTLNWDRSTEHITFVVSTPAILVFNGACTSSQPFSSGQIDLVGTVAGVDGTLSVKFAGCGIAPAVTFVKT